MAESESETTMDSSIEEAESSGDSDDSEISEVREYLFLRIISKNLFNQYNLLEKFY